MKMPAGGRDGGHLDRSRSRAASRRHLHETLINQVCADMMSDAATLQFHGMDCKLVSYGGVPTYVRPNPGH